MISLTLRDRDSVSNEILHLTTLSPTDPDECMTRSLQSQLPQNLTLHVGHEESLLGRASQRSESKELILAPIKLHRRNIQRRLRESQVPKDRFEFTDPTGLGKQLLQSVGHLTKTIDRIDRLSIIRSILADGHPSVNRLAVPSDPQAIEQARTEIENVTGFHPERLHKLRDAADELTSPIDEDSTEVIDVAVSIQRALRHRTEKAVSEVEFVRRAVRVILNTQGDLWQTTLPNVDRVALVGMSSVSAAHADLLHAVLETSTVPVHVHFRRGTGSYLARRLPKLFDVNDPGAVVFEP